MIEGVLFDLDGTLLDVDIDALIEVYFSRLGPVAAPLFDSDIQTALDAVMGGTKAMFAPHPGMTNKEAFNTYVLKMTGVDCDEPHIATELDRFYAEEFPTLQADSGPFSGTRDAIQTCFDLGLKVGIATQPIFPWLATEARMRWAEIDSFDLPIVSTYENSSSTKPNEDYFMDMVSRIDVDPTNCIMVGDEPVLDMDARKYGFTTFYVGSKPKSLAPSGEGRLEDLVSFLHANV